MPFIRKYPTPAAFMVASSYAWCSSDHTGLYTVHAFLLQNYTPLPDAGKHRELPKWLLCFLHKGNVHISVCCCAVVRYELLGIHALHKLGGVSVWATLSTPRCSGRPEESVDTLWLARCSFLQTFFCVSSL